MVVDQASDAVADHAVGDIPEASRDLARGHADVLPQTGDDRVVKLVEVDRSSRLQSAVLAQFRPLLQARGDFGQGVLMLVPGPARGQVRSTWRLTLRLNRGLCLTCAVASVVPGVVSGDVTTSVTDIFASDAPVQQILNAGAATPEQLLNAFPVMILGLVGIVAAISSTPTEDTPHHGGRPWAWMPASPGRRRWRPTSSQAALRTVRLPE